ncbi:hypothetical protein I6N95_15645 [Vagococcus sp. BWB3-3]|uniref:LPXTG cell wall anchor domain-containing protein n=1 Tax=Vagococcus allomyrinae TaxID=2794353 RepID=A0A940PD97_9ENTE|nr:hypothetical protein [Vagococcus allomyrinae]MBP1042452.1 hypothetical protein [Vagococcus allomyrinae]
MKTCIKWLSGMILLLSVYLMVPISAMADNTSVDKPTDVGVGFEKDQTTLSSGESVPDVPKQPDEVIIPKYNSKSLPQLGKFVEPMAIVLLGLLIWIAVLSIIALNRYLRKEGEV